MPLPKEVERRQAVLAVNDQKFILWFAEMSHTVRGLNCPKPEMIIREEKDRAGNHWLAYRRFIEVNDLTYLPTIEKALKRLLAFLDSGNKPRYFIVPGGLRLNPLTLEIIPAGELHLVEQVSRFIRNKVKHPLFLPNPCGQHSL
jgi:hypothetical protein